MSKNVGLQWCPKCGCGNDKVGFAHLSDCAETQKLVVAFVQGAQWWEYKEKGATMWPSDRNLAEDEADKRAKNGTLGISLMDRMPGIMGNIADSIG